MKPVMIVIAGPNGAGKTTVTKRLRQDHWSEGVTSSYLYRSTGLAPFVGDARLRPLLAESEIRIVRILPRLHLLNKGVGVADF